MTVGTLLATISSRELADWMILRRIEYDERAAEEKRKRRGTGL